MNKKGTSIMQIFLLVVAIFAFSFILGSSFGTVSASDGECPDKCENGVLSHKGTIKDGKCVYETDNCAAGECKSSTECADVDYGEDNCPGGICMSTCLMGYTEAIAGDCANPLQKCCISTTPTTEPTKTPSVTAGTACTTTDGKTGNCLLKTTCTAQDRTWVSSPGNGVYYCGADTDYFCCLEKTTEETEGQEDNTNTGTTDQTYIAPDEINAENVEEVTNLILDDMGIEDEEERADIINEAKNAIGTISSTANTVVQGNEFVKGVKKWVGEKRGEDPDGDKNAGSDSNSGEGLAQEILNQKENIESNEAVDPGYTLDKFGKKVAGTTAAGIGKKTFKQWLGQKVGQYSMWGTILTEALTAFATAYAIAGVMEAYSNERNSRGVWLAATVAGTAATVGTTMIVSSVASSAAISAIGVATAGAGIAATTTAAEASAMVSEIILSTTGGTATAAAEASAAAAAAIEAGAAPATAVQSALVGSGTFGLGAGAIMGIAAAAVIVLMGTYLAITSKDHYREVVEYTPELWQPSTDSYDCMACNDLEFGCNEYQCKSYGPSCELINKGEVEEKCVSVGRDREPPILNPIDSALRTGYVYDPLPAVLPGVQGVKIAYKADPNGCIPPFEPMLLAVNSSKPVQCKIDLENKLNFDDMNGFMDGSLYKEEHYLAIPGSASASTEALEGIGISKLNDDKPYQFFVKCQDYNGVDSTYNLLMEFCVQEGPDTTAPKILRTNYVYGSYVQNNQTEVPLEIYTNEPADCRWDFEDKTYSEMENEMVDCSQDMNDYLYDGSFTYGCRSTLTGIKDETENIYYMKCKDKPWWEEGMEGRRVENTESTVLILQGTNTLSIDSLTINGKETGSVIRDSSSPIKVTFEVKTVGGAEEGNAVCAFKGIEESYAAYNDFYNKGNFEYTPTNVHNEWFPAGEYQLMVRCMDKALNLAYQTINISLIEDLESPVAVRAYYKENKMNLITDEEAECVYSTIESNYEFSEGTKIITEDRLHHSLPWDTESNLYVKCVDTFGNAPGIDETTITVRAYQSYESTE